MQKVDTDMLDRLIDKYRSLDKDGSGFLKIGLEVPDAVQVGALQVKQARLLAQTGKQPELMDLWLEQRKKNQIQRERAEARGGGV